MNLDLNQSIEYASTFLDENRNDEAIDLLRGPGAPKDALTCALLARAYYQRGDTRGDLFSSHFFAHRAIELGFDESWLYVIAAISSYRKEQYQEAADLFDRVVDEESFPATQALAALSYLYVGRIEDARKWIDRAVAKHPNNASFKDVRRRVEEGKPPGGGVWESTRTFHLGGIHDAREEDRPTPYKHNALSKLRGLANRPKDIDWLEKNIPCQKACPAGTDIPGYLSAIYRGEFDKAYRINLVDNVFPAVLGRVCSRPCEAACRHGWEGLGESVAICFSKRSAADFKDQAPVVLDPWYPPSGKKVAVVGSGVAGLAAARNLALLGHQVTVYEKHRVPGGMMNQGIPVFRLPRDHIDREIDQIRMLGVEIVCGVEIGGDLPLRKLVDDHDAVVMAAGTLRPNMLDLPGKDLKGIRHGLEFLLEANDAGTATVGKHVIVIGGGFTAMDCARTAKRLGATIVEMELQKNDVGDACKVVNLYGENVRVWYRRSANEMLVTPGELEELMHESIPMEFMVSPKAYIGENGHVTRMRFVRTQLGEPDASGRRRPVEIPDSEFEVEADTVLLATGQFPDTAWIDREFQDDLVQPDQWLTSGRGQTTARDKIFIAGDFAGGASTLIDAIAHAKDAARAVDTFLMGEERLMDVAIIEDATETGRIREMDEVTRQIMPTLPLDQRSLEAEVEKGYPGAIAPEEAQRCYFCHFKYEIDPDKCIYCDWCIKAKPRPDCIIKVKTLKYGEDGRILGWERADSSEETNLIWINQEDCIRCNACVDACPVDCISIQKVTRDTIPGGKGACACGSGR